MTAFSLLCLHDDSSADLLQRAGAYATLEKYLMRWLPAVGFPHHSEAQCDYDEALEVQLSYNFNLVATGRMVFSS